MLELINPSLYVDFMKYRYHFLIFSTVLLIISGVAIGFKGLNYGIDFAGGALIQVKFDKDIKTDELRKALDPIGLGSATLQSIGPENAHEYLIKTMATDKQMQTLAKKIENDLDQKFGKVEIRRVEMVGGAVSQDLQRKAWWSLFFVCITIMVYIWFRFEFRFGVGALASLFHDLAIVTGILAITGREIEMPVLAALLTLLGYSIMDTIVVFDRVRENMRKGDDSSLQHLLSSSISQTLSRTIITSLLTLFAVVCLYFLGGEVLHNFAFTMMVGIIFGTYSSIFIACPFVLLLDRPKKQA